MDIIQFAQLYFDDCVLASVTEVQNTEPAPCCDEMKLLLAMSNGAIEMCGKLEDYFEVVTHAEHAELR